jgi:hypothetical protein
MARQVIGPDGVTWRIRRRAFDAAVTPRWRGSEDHPSLLGRFLSPSIGGTEGVLGVTALFVGLVILPVVFAFFFVPVALLVAEAAVFAVLASAGFVGRVALRRPWRIEAASSDGDRCFWLVPRWGDGAALVDAIAAAVRTGQAPPRVPAADGPTAMTRRLPRRRQRR